MNQTQRWSRRWKTGTLVALVVALVLGLAACYPGGPENLGDIGMVLTLKNPQGNFSDMMTYAMDDTVAALIREGDDSSIPIDPRFNPTILEELQFQMDKAGFTREMNPETNRPDVWLRVGAVESEVWLYYYSWPYYGGWYGYGWYYPPYVGTTSFQKGTIVWVLNDLRGIDDPTVKPPLMWVASISGALQNTNTTTASDIRSGISQGFAQSSYIAAQPAGK